MATKPLIVIVGPTASGKSDLAIKIAKQINGEIICADSRTIYKGMDIGTAKPSKEDQKAVKHHLLDVVEPSQKFTVADFQEQANWAINDIQQQGKIPILVGGSGLYIDSVIFNYEFSSQDLPKDPLNPRHNAKDASPKNTKLRSDSLVIGINVEPEVLENRINNRVQGMLAKGLVDEVKTLGQKYGFDISAMQAPAYRAFRGYLDGIKTLEEASEEFARQDRQLARRQRTWFKRNNSIQWVNNPSNAVEIVTTFLNKYL